MFRGRQLGPKVVVDAIDIHDRRREFIALKYPRVNFLHGDLMALPQSHTWDVLYCSNVIEHTHDPRAFIRKAMQHVRGYGVFLAPYQEEEPRSDEHHSVIDDDTFSEFNVDRKLVYESLGWPATDAGKRCQILTVLKP
jgi:SAM-dependent methyltransferase